MALEADEAGGKCLEEVTPRDVVAAAALVFLVDELVAA